MIADRNLLHEIKQKLDNVSETELVRSFQRMRFRGTPPIVILSTSGSEFLKPLCSAAGSARLRKSV